MAPQCVCDGDRRDCPVHVDGPTDAQLERQQELGLSLQRPDLGPLGNYLRDKEPWRWG